jgi:hypothetical protein
VSPRPPAPPGRAPLHTAVIANPLQERTTMKSLILWLCGVPIGVIVLLKIFGVY